MTPTPLPRTVTVEIDGERRVLNGRVAAIVRGVLLAAPDIEAAAGEVMRVTFHCGIKDEDVTVELPKKFYVNRC
jgi:hypothetical protein